MNANTTHEKEVAPSQENHRQESNREHTPTRPLTLSAANHLSSLMGRLRRGVGDSLHNAGDSFSGMEIGPGLIAIIGAPPAIGKTALAMQFGFASLEHDPSLRLVVANAEMSGEALLRRELTRRSGVSAKAIRFARLTPAELHNVEQASSDMTEAMERVNIMEPPFTLERLEEICEREPGLLIVDYLQKFACGEEARQGVNSVMSTLRNIALRGWAVLALSSTTRLPGREGGHNSAQLSLSSFKESGEIEFNADSCYLLRDNSKGKSSRSHVTLDCVKNRHGELMSIPLVFEKAKMRFERSKAHAEAADKPFWDHDE